ncbi:tripartite tricarboxylate transporter substrate binding protein [Polynucleobacter sp. 15G-AUS-farblos]|uniref:Bug family tripartite tricarboxylate transporter substrate binding protein n=1 Tax=Polynucleobacter sp. 15G-AUS-farblos TaxID=2689094 RepID=UPI001C0CCE92|nr:tripartite tricarboxylate transporter substrate-binding protein [Polynucleobacter sp. 15G-AUS-farblos]MBU3582830.1 tripartite tricarboxylate transporter substrate binding protein [Polynucleobacter sp. 15G-AUS-farblos]
MKTSRRDFITYGSAFAFVNSVPSFAFAQSKPLFESINMFVPAAPGGGWDSTARAIEMAAKDAGLVGSFQFENVGGAGGMVGLPRFVNQRKGQGNALMVGGSVMVGAAITNKSPVTMADVTPIACLTEEAGILVVPTDGKIKNWKDFEEAIKANPKAVSVAGGSAGGTDHLLLGLIIKALGKNPREAAYVAFAGGGPANAAILGGQVVAGISGYSEFAEQIKAGKMRALAVSGSKRIPGVDVPTFKELGLNITAANWRGVFGAPGINAAQKAALVDLVTKMHDTKSWAETLEKRKWTDAFLAGAAFEAQIKKNIAETETVLKELGLA